MRVFARRERPHPGAQLTLFEAGGGWRHSLRATNRPAIPKGWLGQTTHAWLTASMTWQTLLARLKLLALDGGLARAEPKTVRYRVLHAAARLVRSWRRRSLRIQATWPWAETITTAWQRIYALPQAP
jgi:Transposase DDE domain group 1